MRKMMKAMFLLVSLFVLLQVAPAKAELVEEAIQTALKQAGVDSWIMDEVKDNELLINSFTVGNGVRGSSEISLFRTELVNVLQKKGVKLYSTTTSVVAPTNRLKGEISVLRSAKGMVSKLELSLECDGHVTKKVVDVQDQAVAAVLSGTTFVSSGENETSRVAKQNDELRSRGVHVSSAGTGSTINKDTLQDSQYEISIIGSNGKPRDLSRVNVKNSKSVIIEQRFFCEFEQGEEFKLLVKNCRPAGENDVAVEVLIDGVGMFCLWEDENIKRPGYIQMSSGEQFLIKGWMRWLEKNGTQEGNTLSFRAGKYADSVRAKYGISESETIGGGIGTISFVFRDIHKQGDVLAGDNDIGIGSGSETTTECTLVESHPAKSVNQVVTITYTVAQ